MIHAYDEYYLYITQKKLASMFEIAVNYMNMTIDEFTDAFISSPIAKHIEVANPIYVAGKSANELLAIVLNTTPINIEQNAEATPEYWIGWCMAYVQWYTAKSFEEIFNSFPPSKLLLYYFPYHEMDITKTLLLIQESFNNDSKLKIIRKSRNLTQSDLADISGVPIRLIRAYEQKKLEISKAQGETLYKLAKTLGVTIEELIL